MSDELWVYPAQYNQMFSNGKIKIVEKAYDKGVRNEIVNLINQIKNLEQQLAEANELLKRVNNYGGFEFKEINEYFEKY